MIPPKQDNLPRVSAVMAVYNPNRHVVRAIESVLTQTFPVTELIIVNDGGSEEYIQSVLPDDPRIKYIFQKNGRVAAARNTAIGVAKGDFLAFLDQDDYWFPDKVRRQIEVAHSVQKPCMVVSSVQIVNDHDEILGQTRDRLSQYQTILKERDVFKSLLAGNFIYSSTPMIHRDIFTVSGLFSRRFEPHDDWAMYLEIAASGFPVLLVPGDPLSIWRRHSGNESHNWVRMLRTSSKIVRTFQKRELPPVYQEILTLKLCEVNLDRANTLLYRARPATFRKLIPGYISRFISTNYRLRKHRYPAKFSSLRKSVKRLLISLISAPFSRNLPHSTQESQK